MPRGVQDVTAKGKLERKGPHTMQRVMRQQLQCHAEQVAAERLAAAVSDRD